MRFIWLFIFIWLLTHTALAQETLRPNQLTPGMKGYGLSVFHGTRPERFEVEIVGVLKNSMPKQDMILIKMSGANLEHHKVIAGMSGSPIYIDGKLIGALAYGWTFENDPLAGVTPIHNMLAEIDRKAEPSTSASIAPAPATGNATAQPLLTPLALGGFSTRVINQMNDELRPFGLLPVAGGGSSNTGTSNASDVGDFEPGGSIGVQLIRGDLNATGVGTVSYVDKKRHRVLAFGHPMMHAGLIEAPTVLANVHVIMSSVERSFKMASPLGERGALVGDWQSCIVADTAVKAHMIPLDVSVTNLGTGHREKYAMEIVDNPALTPRFAMMALMEVVSTVSGSSQDTTLRVDFTAELSDRTIHTTNTFFNPSGGIFTPGSAMPLQKLFGSPFGHPKVKRLAVNVEATLDRQTAEIKRAYFEKAQVERGEKAQLHVILKPFGQPEIIKTISLDVPVVTDAIHELMVIVTTGSSVPPDVAIPDNLNDYLNTIEKQHRSTDLIALVPSNRQGLQIRGNLLKNLPPSVFNVLGDDAGHNAIAAADMRQLIMSTDWVLTGSAVAQVSIRQE